MKIFTVYFTNGDTIDVEARDLQDSAGVFRLMDAKGEPLGVFSADQVSAIVAKESLQDGGKETTRRSRRGRD